MNKQCKLRDDLKSYMKQEEQLIGFNSVVPRFKNQTTHAVKVLPMLGGVGGGQENNGRPIVDFVMKKDTSQIGPGAY